MVTEGVKLQLQAGSRAWVWLTPIIRHILHHVMTEDCKAFQQQLFRPEQNFDYITCFPCPL